MSATPTFYAKQVEWGGVYLGPPTDRHRQRAAWVRHLVGAPPRRALELGAGGGQDAVALALLGYEVVAVEQVPRLAEHIRRLRRTYPTAQVTVLEEDFQRVALPAAAFDAVLYWDGFGLGSEADQRRLLRRVRSWLRPQGMALIEVYTPWHAAQAAGHRMRVGRAWREYAFDGEACRWIDRWWTEDEGPLEQRLRCYSPADLRLLLEGTGLRLTAVHPGGRMDYERGRYIASAPLAQAMSYVAVLRPAA